MLICRKNGDASRVTGSGGGICDEWRVAASSGAWRTSRPRRTVEEPSLGSLKAPQGGEQLSDEDLQKSLEPVLEQTEVVAGAGEAGVDAIAVDVRWVNCGLSGARPSYAQ